MTSRNGTPLTWDVENRLTAVGSAESYAYDGDGVRVSKTSGGETTVYVNSFYQKNTTTGIVIKSYYLGGTLIATSEGGTLRYVHQDSLGSSSVATNTSGTSVGSESYLPFGETRESSGTFGTDRKFTGQRLDGGTGLYFYNARYYDASLGRFISPDSVIATVSNPQDLNRYTYVRNNPLIYTDPTGRTCYLVGFNFSIGFMIGGTVYTGRAYCPDGNVGFTTIATHAEVGWEVGVGFTITVVFANSLDELAGSGIHTGGSGGAGLLSVGGEILKSDSTGQITGFDVTAQVGPGSPEAHNGPDSTILLTQRAIKVYDLPKKTSDWVRGHIYKDPKDGWSLVVYIGGGPDGLLPITPDQVSFDSSDGED